MLADADDGASGAADGSARQVEMRPTHDASVDKKGASKRNALRGLGGLVAILLCGVIVGVAAPPHSDDPKPWNEISGIIGWCYFFAWSISFYPQVYLNWKRKSVVGLSFDFEAYNIIGFVCYSIFNCTFYWSSSIQQEYKDTHDGHANVVRLNDVVFAVHAVIVTAFTIFQIFIYDRGTQVVSFGCKVICVFLILIPTVYLVLVWTHVSGSLWTWINLMYCLSYVKLAVTLIKYCPQVYLNWKRKSTIGWNIWNVLLDFMGGSLSVCQLFIDAGTTHDWSAVTGDPVKFGLGFCSMFFDVIFMIQHYCLYTDSNDEDAHKPDGARFKLLPDAEAQRKRRLSWGETTV